MIDPMSVIEETEEELRAVANCEYFSFAGTHLVRVAKCYDGDTIHCIFKHDGRYCKFRLRVYGYDCCEMRPSKKLGEDVRKELKAKALAAKKYVEDLILYSRTGKLVYLICMGQDKYGRLLGDIKFGLSDKETIGDMMIAAGHGYPYKGKTKKSSADQLKIVANG